MRAIAIVLLLACGKKTEVAQPTFDNFHITVDGKRLSIDRAFIKEVSPGVWTVLVGAGKGSCESLIAGTNEGTGQAFSFTVQKRVGPVGHESHILTDLWSRDFDAKVPTGEKVAILDEKVGKDRRTNIILPPMTGERFTIVKGQLTAIGCATPPPSGAGVPKVEHRSRGVILMAGNKLAIQNVTVQVRKGAAAADLPNIVISTGPRDCSGVNLPAPVIIERIDGKWFLYGTWFDGKLEGTEPIELTFSANMAGKSEDGPTVNLQLSGKGKFGDYTVELFGTVEAIECI